MAGTDAVLAALPDDSPASFSVLVPNRKGYDLAHAAGAKTVAVVVSATETMNQKNINMSVAQVMATAAEIIAQGQADGLTVQAYLSVAWECPFEGAVPPEVVRGLAAQLSGADELVIADTIGAANPRAVSELMSALVADHGAGQLACHFHDTRAMALANIYASIEAGVRRFDSSIGGLGGCPFAPGAKGNVATEDVAMLAEQMGFATGVDMARLLEAVDVAKQLTGTCHGGRAHYWLSQQVA
jgi:hydroxymethylglutaryl-CoA lyase